jgi:murein DD-endopeptidase MepM/ murein hydrolase activator NlpD
MRRVLVVAVAVTLTFVVEMPAGADLASDLSEVERRIEELEDAIEMAEGVRTDFAAAVLETAEHLAIVAEELRIAESALADTEQEISLTEQLLSELLDRMIEREALIGRLQATVDEERDLAVERAVEVYMAAHADVTARFIGSDDPSAGVGIVYADRVQGVADAVIDEYELSRLREQQEVTRLAAERLAAQEHRLVLEAQEADRAAAVAEVALRVADVEAVLAEQQALLDEIDNEIDHIEGEIASLEREQDDIEALIEQEQSRAGSAPGSLVRPVPGGVSSGYGWRIHPIYGNSRLHTGWDMNGSCGVPIRSAASGRVFYTGWKGGYGNAVMIDHGGGLSTLYAHQSSIGVSYGAQVVAGEVIGWVGTTGTSTACHLHFETRVNGTPVDPIAYLSP